MRKWLLGIALAWGFAGQVYAEPSPSVSGLMNTPASLFTIGMYRLDLNVRSIVPFLNDLRQDTEHLISTYYIWQENRIYIATATTVGTFENREAFEEHCGEVFSVVRNYGIVDPDTGAVRYNAETSTYASLFGQIGYTNDVLRERLSELDKIIMVRFSSPVDGMGYGRCNGPLLSTGFSASYSN